MPQISVIMPVYNREKFIHTAVNSVINQTFKDWEFIIIDDHSQDKTFEIIKNYSQKDSRIKAFRNEKNSGSSITRNKGISLASGDYIIFLDSDDYFKEFAFEQRIKHFEQNPDYDFLVFPTVRLNKKTGKTRPYNENIKEDHLEQFLNLDPVWQTMSPIWKRESVVKNNLKFDTKMTSLVDADFHILALAKGLKYRLIDTEPDSVYVEHDDPTLSQKGFSFKQRKGHLHFYKKLLTSDLLNQHYKQILRQNINFFIKSITQKQEGKTILKILTSPFWLKTLTKEEKKLLFDTLKKKFKNRF